MQRSLSAGLMLACALLVALVADADAAPRRIPLVLHLVERDGAPVADAAFIATQLEHANAIYRPLGFELVLVRQRKLAARHARLVARDDRDALAVALQPGVLNWFVVASLMDVDEPGRERRGVHWRLRTDRRRHYVIVSAISGPYVLAHELGHFFGNPEHSDVPGNLMSYQHTGEVPVLDAAQQQRVREAIAAMFASGELTTANGGRVRRKLSAVAP
jgi:hypothetical protein